MWAACGAARVGRANIDGSNPDNNWYATGDQLGPYDFAADDQHIYWTHSEPTGGGASYVQRVNVDGTGAIPTYATGSPSSGTTMLGIGVALAP